MKSFTFRPNVALSDIAFYAYGKTISEMIENACAATIQAMVTRENIEEKMEAPMEVQGDTLEQLLYNVLEEVIFLKDARQLIFRSFKVEQIQTDHAPFSIRLIAKGEVIDRQKHAAHADVKAVTYQDFKIEKYRGDYRASVTLDI